VKYTPMTSRIGILREALPREPLGVAEDAACHQSSISRPSIASCRSAWEGRL
jgi:hypothetical protein